MAPDEDEGPPVVEEGREVDRTPAQTFTAEGLALEVTATGTAGIAVKATSLAGTAINAQGTSIGVEATATAGYGVRATCNPASGIGVRGQSQNGLGVSGIGPIGVIGESNGTKADAIGVMGEAPMSSAGAGVKGKGAIGVHGDSIGQAEHAIGVYGSTPQSASGVGVRGDSCTGVLGVGTREGLQGTGPTGVLGVDTVGSAEGLGVRGATTAGSGIKGEADTGTGVWGAASGAGVGVRATSEAGTALRVEGVADFQGPVRARRSGIVMVMVGEKDAVVVDVPDITDTTVALAVCQKDLKDCSVRSAVLDADKHTLTITLTKRAEWSMPVGWFLVN